MLIYPLGDAALTIEFGDVIDEKINDQVINLFNALKNEPIEGVIDLVPAYSTLTIHYKLQLSYPVIKQRVSDFIAGKTVRRLLPKPSGQDPVGEELNVLSLPRQIKVPVCYDPALAPDLDYVAKQKGLTTDQIISVHTSQSYRVYMLGFLPGFPYMGSINKEIEIPRKPQPVMVKAGSVGIAGLQTGIYPLDSPGGWQIIGQTPLKIFDKDKEEPCLFRPGDQASFYSISKDEFESH